MANKVVDFAPSAPGALKRGFDTGCQLYNSVMR